MLLTWRICCSRISQKWIFIILAFLGILIGNGLRVILSITITEMVPMKENIKFADDTCVSYEKHIRKNTTIIAHEMFDWDEYTQGIILSSFFWGYAAMQLPFGTLSERFGGKYLLGFGTFIPAVITFLTPIAINWGGSTALIISRVIMGVTSGAMYPAASTMVCQWTTPSERSRFGSIIFAGGVIGTVVGTTVPALIISYSGLGWPAVFHVFGVMGIVWFIFWTVLCYNKPEEHPFISQIELQYLHDDSSKDDNKLFIAPWKHILMSKQFWAFALALIGCDWAFFTMANSLPKYMSSVVKLSIENNGYFSSLPYLFMWISTIISTWLSDQCIQKKWMSVTNTRKCFAILSLISPATFMIGASYAKCDQLLVVAMFVIGMTLMGACYPSLMVNALDLSPNYSGTLMSIGNSLAALGGIVSPYITGLLTPNQTIGEWRLVFWITLGVAIVASTYFFIYASFKVQDWNEPNLIKRNNKN